MLVASFKVCLESHFATVYLENPAAADDWLKPKEEWVTQDLTTVWEIMRPNKMFAKTLFPD